MPAGGCVRRVGLTAILCVAATLEPVRLGSAAAAAPEPAALPAAAKPAPTVPYRVGYTSSDVPRLAAVDAGSGAPAISPTGDLRAEEASARPGAVVFVTYRTGHVDAELTYRATGATAPRLLTTDRDAGGRQL